MSVRRGPYGTAGAIVPSNGGTMTDKPKLDVRSQFLVGATVAGADCSGTLRDPACSPTVRSAGVHTTPCTRADYDALVDALARTGARKGSP